MKANFSRVHEFLIGHFYFLDIGVRVLRLNYTWIIKPWHEKFNIASAIPDILLNYLLRFNIDVVNRRW